MIRKKREVGPSQCIYARSKTLSEKAETWKTPLRGLRFRGPCLFSISDLAKTAEAENPLCDERDLRSGLRVFCVLVLHEP
jgi:hypothetical protein